MKQEHHPYALPGDEPGSRDTMTIAEGYAAALVLCKYYFRISNPDERGGFAHLFMDFGEWPDCRAGDPGAWQLWQDCVAAARAGRGTVNGMDVEQPLDTAG